MPSFLPSNETRNEINYAIFFEAMNVKRDMKKQWLLTSAGGAVSCTE
jgi:hypothetical protein